MSAYLRPRNECTEQLLLAITNDPWLARYAIAQVCLFMELGHLNELVDQVLAADKVVVEADREYFQRLVRERFGIE